MLWTSDNEKTLTFELVLDSCLNSGSVNSLVSVCSAIRECCRMAC